MEYLCDRWSLRQNRYMSNNEQHHLPVLEMFEFKWMRSEWKDADKGIRQSFELKMGL